MNQRLRPTRSPFHRKGAMPRNLAKWISDSYLAERARSLQVMTDPNNPTTRPRTPRGSDYVANFLTAPARIRHSVLAILAVSWIFIGAPQSAIAQTTIPIHPIPVYWDASNPTNRAESRQYAAIVWQAEDLGQPVEPGIFTFTNPTPDALLVTLSAEIALFERLYVSRLGALNSQGEPYSILDLMRDTPAIDAQFREYVLTGSIQPLPGESMAEFAHLEMATDAITSQQRYAVDQVSAQQGTLLSVNLRFIRSPQTGFEGDPQPSAEEPVPQVPLEAGDDFGCVLRWFMSRSHLDCMYGKGLYQQGNQGIDFDCDDFTDVTLWWLRHFQVADGKAVLIRWFCNGQYAGHWMPYVVRDGKFYLIDPYTAKVHGPFNTFDRMVAAAMQLFVPANCPDFKSLSAIAVQPRPNGGVQGTGNHAYPYEALPWWHSWTMRQRFCEKLAECCGAIGFVPNCPAPPGMPPIQDPCQMLHYVPGDGVVPEGHLCTTPNQIPPATAGNGIQFAW